MSYRILKRVAAPVVAILAVAVTGSLAVISPVLAHGGRCERRVITVTLTGDRPAPRHRLATWLCKPSRPTTVVQVLMSGFTYDHHYWTMGRRPYVRAAVAAGHAVLYVDRISVGDSGRPPAAQVTADSEAYVAHQLVRRLRDDRFRTVIGVGHSYGALVWAAEAAAYDDVDALVLSGYLHKAHLPTQLRIRANLHAASLEPAFADAPDGYLTTMPNFRRHAYLHLPGVESRMVTLDERLKVTGTTGELESLKNLADPTYSNGIRRPVLLQTGTRDALFCDAATGLACATPADLCRREKPLFPRAALSATVVPGTGHAIAVHRAAPRATDTVLDWINHIVRRAPAPRAVTHCTY